MKLFRLCHKLAECISTAVYAFCWLIFWFVLCSFVSHFISIVHAMWHFRFLPPPHSRLQIGDDVSFFTQESTIEGFMACPLSTQQYGTALIQPAKNKRGEKDGGVKRKHFSFLLLFSSSLFFLLFFFLLLFFPPLSSFSSYLYCRVHSYISRSKWVERRWKLSVMCISTPCWRKVQAYQEAGKVDWFQDKSWWREAG